MIGGYAYPPPTDISRTPPAGQIWVIRDICVLFEDGYGTHAWCQVTGAGQPYILWDARRVNGDWQHFELRQTIRVGEVCHFITADGPVMLAVTAYQFTA